MFTLTTLVLLTSVACPGSVALTLVAPQDAINYEYVQLDVVRNVRGERDAEDDFHVKITRGGEPLTLHYRRNKRLDRPFPVHLVGDSQREVIYKIDTEVAAYQGVDHPGAVIIRENTNKRSGVEVEGYIYHEDKWLVLQAAEDGDHVIHETSVLEESLGTDTLGRVQVLDEADTPEKTTSTYIEKRDVDLTDEMNVETRINFDYSSYTLWESRTSGAFVDDAAKKARVIENIREYYVLVINAIDLRYRPFREAGININVVVGGLIISETQLGSHWTEYDNIDPSLKYSSGRALDKFNAWLKQRGIVSDHAQLHTTRSGGGLADIGNMCSKYRAALVGDRASIIAAGIGAHELGHVLAIPHDPINAACPGGGMMAPSIGGSGNWAVTNCSLNVLRSRLTNKIDNSYNCLKQDNTNKVDVSEFEKYTDQNLGEKYSPHQQCWLKYGSDNMLNRYTIRNGLEEICRVLWCSKKSNQRLVYGAEAFPHTQCGDKKWCELGKCITDEINAPELDPYCLLGDMHIDCWKRVNSTSLSLCYEGQVLHKECCTTCKKNKLTDPVCEYGYSHPTCNLHQCYPGNQQKCCSQFCIDNKKDVPGCEWGDKISRCTKMDCYDPVKAAGECCKSCPEWKTNVTNCPWGNKGTPCERKHCYTDTGLDRCCGSCAVWKGEGHPDTCQYGETWYCYMYHFLCYNKRHVCCLTCPKVKAARNNPACPYGDRTYTSRCNYASNPHKCYKRYRKCCDSCEKLITGPDYCKWGDKIDDCTPASCNVTRYQCCNSCPQ